MANAAPDIEHIRRLAARHQRYCRRMNASSAAGQMPAASGTGR
jgi:hypothetical protein